MGTMCSIVYTLSIQQDRVVDWSIRRILPHTWERHDDVLPVWATIFQKLLLNGYIFLPVSRTAVISFVYMYIGLVTWNQERVLYSIFERQAYLNLTNKTNSADGKS